MEDQKGADYEYSIKSHGRCVYLVRTMTHDTYLIILYQISYIIPVNYLALFPFVAFRINLAISSGYDTSEA